MKQFKFKDQAGNNYQIKAEDRWAAFKIAKEQITIKPFHLVTNIKLKR